MFLNVKAVWLSVFSGKTVYGHWQFVAVTSLHFFKADCRSHFIHSETEKKKQSKLLSENGSLSNLPGIALEICASGRQKNPIPQGSIQLLSAEDFSLFLQRLASSTPYCQLLQYSSPLYYKLVIQSILKFHAWSLEKKYKFCYLFYRFCSIVLKTEVMKQWLLIIHWIKGLGISKYSGWDLMCARAQLLNSCFWKVLLKFCFRWMNHTDWFNDQSSRKTLSSISHIPLQPFCHPVGT